MSAVQRRETPPDRAATRALRKEVREILEAGGIAALPTETVYGLAARADLPEALERLKALKGRGTSDGLSLHVGDTSVLEQFSVHRSVVRRLATKHWPGPLTLVLSGVPEGLAGIARDGWTGVRFPAHAAVASLLEFCPFPIVMTSANRAGEPPATDAEGVEARFERASDARLDLIVDSGPARLAESSTVLQVGPGRFEVLRGGLVDLDTLRRTAGLSIGFVCTGNTCRSPMAETLAREVLARRLHGAGQAPPGLVAEFGFEVGSAGVFAGTGSPASEHAVEVIAARGLDLSRHGSQPATPELVRSWDRVYCLTAAHRDSLLASLPPSRAGHVELLDPAGRDVPDPIGGSLADYRECARQIETSLEKRCDDWV